MHKVIKIRKGLDIRLKGEVEVKEPRIYSPALFAVEPTRFRMMNPRLLVQEGDTVQCGTPVVQNKFNELMFLTSPVSGVVKRVVRGDKRKLLSIEIEHDNKNNYIDFGKENPDSTSREAIIDKLLRSGIWPLLRQRPYAVIASPTDTPRDIFISAFNSAPLAANTDAFVAQHKDIFKTGIDVLKMLTTGAIHLGLHVRKNDESIYSGIGNIEIHHFDGPHPSGNIGVQIHRISPLNKGEVVWYLYPQDVVAIGQLFVAGKREIRRLVTFAGSELKQPAMIEMLAEASVSGLLTDNLTQDNVRVISGDVLTGTSIGKDGFLGFYDQMISVIPEGDHYEFLGWALPGFKKHSMSHAFFSWLTPKKKYRLHTNFNGGERAFVVTNQYDKVFPFDIYPVHLLKAILVNDIDLMEKLGIYEVAEEDFALCEYVCTSKIESQDIMRNGIDTMIKEMS